MAMVSETQRAGQRGLRSRLMGMAIPVMAWCGTARPMGTPGDVPAVVVPETQASEVVGMLGRPDRIVPEDGTVSRPFGLSERGTLVLCFAAGRFVADTQALPHEPAGFGGRCSGQRCWSSPGLARPTPRQRRRQTSSGRRGSHLPCGSTSPAGRSGSAESTPTASRS